MGGQLVAEGVHLECECLRIAPTLGERVLDINDAGAGRLLQREGRGSELALDVGAAAIGRLDGEDSIFLHGVEAGEGEGGQIESASNADVRANDPQPTCRSRALKTFEVPNPWGENDATAVALRYVSSPSNLRCYAARLSR